MTGERLGHECYFMLVLTPVEPINWLALVRPSVRPSVMPSLQRPCSSGPITRPSPAGRAHRSMERNDGAGEGEVLASLTTDLA